MRRRSLATALALSIGIVIALTALTSAAAQLVGERVVVSPGEGAATTNFRFTGSGYVPGSLVRVAVTPPDGIERRLISETGAEMVWLVSPDGHFELEVVPAQRFAPATPGRWQALFCTSGSVTCQLIDFDVLP